MKTYKFLTIHKNDKSDWEYSENLTNEWSKEGWEIDHVSPIEGSNGDILLVLSKSVGTNNIQMICD